MDKILNFIEKETKSTCFTSYKYCFDNNPKPGGEYEDRQIDPICLKKFAESDHSPKPRDMRPIFQKRLLGPPLFKYFLDGSRRVYKIDDMLYGNKVYPIISGQISVACCEREVDNNNKFKAFKNIKNNSYSVLSLPYVLDGEHQGDVFFNCLCNKLNEHLNIKRPGYQIEKILSYETLLNGQETLENKGIARIQDEMINCEKKIVSELTKDCLLSHDKMLIKDGSIQYKRMKKEGYKDLSRIRNNYRYVVGVSKKFNPNLMKNVKGQSSADQIAKLPLFYRTPAYLWEPPNIEFGEANFAIWYVRIRAIKKSDTPYSGVLKIEKMLMTGTENEDGLNSEEIDTITANIINERNPVCYGLDTRWANHLYPIYMTERFCKSKFKGDLQFLNLF